MKSRSTITKLTVRIYGPDRYDIPIGTLELTWPDDTEKPDIIADTTEAVVQWCSANGYTYDRCDWDYVS